MRILVFSKYYLPGFKGGGPIKTIKNLFDQVGDVIDFELITSDRDLNDKTSYSSVCCGKWNQVGNALVFYVKSGVSGFLAVTQILREGGYELIYLNSFFSIKFSLFPLLVSKILARKIVLGPRGEFSTGALKIKPNRKKLFLFFYKILRLHTGIVFQASSKFEAEDIRRVLGDSSDIFIAEDIGAQEFANNIQTRIHRKLNAVFISRISPKKNLLEALKILKGLQEPLVYHIYGPIEDEFYWLQCKSVIAELPSYIEVKYMGLLMPVEVISTLSNYDVFFFPTAGENYGHVIAEALCAGLPLVIADTTPWHDLQQHGIGWDLSLLNPVSFSAALDELTVMPPEQHLKMRQKVLAWAKKRFSQREAIEANISMFNYAVGKNKG